ncbi:VanZ-domain-containing protein, partial [Ascodesmis nigricans]
IRVPFAVSFVLLTLIAAYLGLSSIQVPINDKVLHFITFFLLTLVFYWIIETSRRRIVHATLLVCTLFLGIGSEFLQSFTTIRAFDPFDILANLVGSVLGLLLCTQYHRRMLERRRLAKSGGAYAAVAGDETVEFEHELGEMESREEDRLRDLERGEDSDGDIGDRKERD